MRNDSLSFNQEAVLKSKFRVPLFNELIQEYLTEEDGDVVWSVHRYPRAQEVHRCAPIDFEANAIHGGITFFALLDYYIESGTGILKGSKSLEKYNQLQSTDNISTITKACYRILRQLIDASNEHLGAIQMRQEGISFEYVKTVDEKPTTFSLSMNKESVKILWEMVYLIVNENLIKDRGQAFKEGILCWYYNELISAIGEGLKDDIRECMEALKYDIASDYGIQGLELKLLNPDRAISTECIIEELAVDKFYIKNIEHSHPKKRDFHFVINQKCYLVPEEHLEDGHITQKAMHLWQIEKESPYYLMKTISAC